MAEILFDLNLYLDQSYLNTCIGMEPNNRVIQYGLKNLKQVNEDVTVNNGNYNSLSWNYFPSLFSSQALKHIGIKSFPQIGAIGFFSCLYEELSVVLAPIVTDSNFYEAPTTTIIQDTNSITFNISNPTGVTYDCFRIAIRKDQFATEYVTYSNVLVIDKPLTGTYQISIMGYIDDKLSSTINYYPDIEIDNPNPVPAPIGDTVYSVNDQAADINGNVDLSSNEIPFAYENFSANNVTAALIEVYNKTKAIIITLVASDWINKSQIIENDEITSTSLLIVAPIPSYQRDYVSADIICAEQSNGTLTFTCNSTPSNNLQVGVIII